MRASPAKSAAVPRIRPAARGADPAAYLLVGRGDAGEDESCALAFSGDEAAPPAGVRPIASGGDGRSPQKGAPLELDSEDAHAAEWRRRPRTKKQGAVLRAPAAPPHVRMSRGSRPSGAREAVFSDEDLLDERGFASPSDSIASDRSESVSGGAADSSSDPSDSAPSEDEYEVEEIRAVRTTRRGTEYLVKWLGYPEADNTWEPAAAMHCDELIAAFEAQRAGKGGGRGVSQKGKKAVAPMGAAQSSRRASRRQPPLSISPPPEEPRTSPRKEPAPEKRQRSPSPAKSAPKGAKTQTRKTAASQAMATDDEDDAPLNAWGDIIFRVLSTAPDAYGALCVRLALKDARGTRTVPLAAAHRLCPLVMCEYYEGLLREHGVFPARSVAP